MDHITRVPEHGISKHEISRLEDDLRRVAQSVALLEERVRWLDQRIDLVRESDRLDALFAWCVKVIWGVVLVALVLQFP